MATKVLFIYDDYWHPADVIDRGLRSVGSQLSHYELDFVRTAKDILTPACLENYPVIVNAKSNQISSANTHPWFEPGVTEVMPEDFEAYVRAGGGFLALHAGNAFFLDHTPNPQNGTDRAVQSYIRFVGNSFAGHPPRCPVTVYPVQDHPITHAVSPFTERDEHYQLENLAGDIDVFLKSKSESGGERIAGYTRQMGDGRLCALLPGHHVAVWENPQFQRLLCQAIDWCAKFI